MMVPSSAALASRFLDPLTHPWAAVGAALSGGGIGWNDVSTIAVRAAWRLLHFLLSL